MIPTILTLWLLASILTAALWAFCGARIEQAKRDLTDRDAAQGAGDGVRVLHVATRNTTASE